MEKSLEIMKDGEKNAILGWIKENTRMNFVHCKINASKQSGVIKTNERSKSDDTAAMKFSSMNRQQHPAINSRRSAQTPPSSYSSSSFLPSSTSSSFHHPPLSQSSPFFNPPSSSSPLENYFYDKTDFNKPHDRNIRRYIHNDMQQADNRQSRSKLSTNFYHLACIGPDDVAPVSMATMPMTKSKVGCHGDGVDDQDDDDYEDDAVFQFLEIYRRTPELTKFQAKVYLELSKDHSNSSMFLCPDDSKRFITIHDFSANQMKACNKLININNTCSPALNSCNSNTIIYDESDLNQVKVTPKSDLYINRGHEAPPKVVGRFDKTTYAKTYAFDRIFMPEEPVAKVYIESATLVLKAVLSGRNGSIVCYGEPDGPHRTSHHHHSVTSTLTRLTLRWLYTLLEESSHDATSTYSVKVSAVEFVGTSDSIKDLLIDQGMKSKATTGDDKQPRFIRVANFKEARLVHQAALKARSDNLVNTIFTVHVRQYHVRLPNQQRVVSLSNQLHIINISARQKEEIQKEPQGHHPQSRDGPLASLVGKDNLLQFIGTLMIGQRIPLASLSKLHNLLQNCILPSNVQCQTCLIIRLGPHPIPFHLSTNNKNDNNLGNNHNNNNKEIQKLLNLGTKIYKRRFSKYKHLKYPGQPFFLMNSSASETSSCASSGLSNLRKSKVKMGTQHWQKKLDQVHCSASIPAQSRDFQAHLNWSANPSRPNYLELEHKFSPKISLDKHGLGAPPPSLIKNNWKGCGRVVQDTILEHPEDKWETGRTITPSETWIDGPAATMSSPYDNIFQREGCSHRTNPYFGNAESGQSFQSSYRTNESYRSRSAFQGIANNASQSMNFITRKDKIFHVTEPMKSFDSYDRLIQNPERCLLNDSLKCHQSPLPFSYSVTALCHRNHLINNSINKPSNQWHMRKSSLTNSDTAPQLGWRKPTESLRNRLGSSSIYESWFEDKIEKGMTNILTESFTVNQSESLPAILSANHVQNNSKILDTSIQRGHHDFIKNNDKFNNESNGKSSKNVKNYKFLKKLKDFFTKNPPKHPSSSSSPPSSSSSLSSPTTLPKLIQSLDNEQPIKTGNRTPVYHHPDPIGRSSVKSPKKLNSSFDRAVKKSLSFFVKHKSQQKMDLIAMVPATPKIYYDNQASSTLASANSSSMFNFPSLPLKSSNMIDVDAKPEPRKSESHQWPYAEVVGGNVGQDSGLSRRGLSSEVGIDLHKGAGFYAFVDDEEDDARSHIESSVANVVCYRRVPFNKGGRDQGSKNDPTLLAPSYYRFSKLSSDGDEGGEGLSINEYNNNNNNNNDNVKRSSLGEENLHNEDYYNFVDGGDDDDVSNDYVRIKKLQVINNESSSPSIIKNDDDDDDDHRSAPDDDYVKKSNQDDDDDDNDDVIKIKALPVEGRRRNKIVGFISRGKLLVNRKTCNKWNKERCTIQ